MTYALIKEIFEANQASNNNTYLVPSTSFECFIRDELTYVQSADDHSCTVWRAMDGKPYNLSKDQIKKFHCVSSCNRC